MILSMTGHGQSQKQSETHTVDCEVRATNNRFLKINMSWNDRFASLETGVQSVVRAKARRGTIYVAFKVNSIDGKSGFSINTSQLEAYREQLGDLQTSSIDDMALLNLPGVIEEAAADSNHAESIWPMMKSALNEALDSLVGMRQEEGASMARDLHSNVDCMATHLDSIAERAPQVVQDYSQRLVEKINVLLEPHETEVSSADIVREVGIFADRSDISEEIVRLKSHMEQFRANLESSRGDGRKLEFLTQEMLRETNTIGSKANDSGIAHHVVEIKTAIERIREMVQNIE